MVTSDDSPEPSGPYFDDLALGDSFEVPTPVTLTSGMAAAYRCVVGDSPSLSTDSIQCAAVTGSNSLMADPALIAHLSIGASTVATRLVLGNLFYRNVVFRRQVFIGETLRTETTVAGLADASPKPGHKPRGKVLLDITTTTGDGDTVLGFQRCALLPNRSETAVGHNDRLGTGASAKSFEELPTDLLETVTAAIPSAWNTDSMRRSPAWELGQTLEDSLADVIDQALGLVRLTSNWAQTHRDSRASTYGRRLVYGGHVIGLAQASLVRCRPGLITVLGWLGGDHLGPAFEGDMLSFRHQLLAEFAVAGGQIRLVETVATALREGSYGAGDSAGNSAVLRWCPIIMERSR